MAQSEQQAECLPSSEQAAPSFTSLAATIFSRAFGGTDIGRPFGGTDIAFTSQHQAYTFRPRRGHLLGARQRELQRRAQSTLGTGNLHDAVKLPVGEDVNEWLAIQSIEFYNEVGMVYGIVAESCTHAGCPVMCAGPNYEYAWADGLNTRPMAVSAPQYVGFLMRWVQGQLDDERLFPTQPGIPFLPDFYSRVQTIFRRLFRVYAHIYHSHLELVVALGAEPHLNTCFKHFMYLVREFDLIPNPKELEPLQTLINQLFHHDAIKYNTPLGVTMAIVPETTANLSSVQAATMTANESRPNALAADQLDASLRATNGIASARGRGSVLPLPIL